MVSQELLIQSRLCPLYLYSEVERRGFTVQGYPVLQWDPVLKPASQSHVLVDKLFLMLHGMPLRLFRSGMPAYNSSTSHGNCAYKKTNWLWVCGSQFLLPCHDLSKNVSTMQTLILKIILCQILYIVKLYMHTGFILWPLYAFFFFWGKNVPNF